MCTGLPNPQSTLIARPSLFGIELASERAFAWFSLGVLVLSVLMVRLWRDRGVARRLMAVRDNETGAGAMGIPLARTKLLAFALSGFIAGYAGVCLAFATERFSTATFDPSFSILVVSMVVIGGLGSIDGAVLGAVYLVGIPAMFGTTPTIQFLTSGLGLLAFILYLPGGLADLLHRLGDLVTLGVERLLSPGCPRGRTTAPTRAEPARTGRDGAGMDGWPDDAASPRGRPTPGRAGPAGRGGGGGRLRRRAGGRRGRPLGRTRCHRRADRAQRLGQDHHARRHLRAGDPGRGLGAPGRREPGRVPARGAGLPGRRALLPGLPALPRAVGGGSPAAHPGRPPAGGRRVLHAAAPVGPALASGPSGSAVDQVIDSFGIDRFRRHQIAQLSTGTRRVVDLASIVLARPRLLLLDEPTAGIAQREAEAFVPLLRRLHQLADTTIVLVEHDVPLVFALCTKVVMMETGSVVSSGTPDEVERDPRALAAYLGASEEALAVSGACRHPGRPSRPRRPCGPDADGTARSAEPPAHDRSGSPSRSCSGRLAATQRRGMAGPKGMSPCRVTRWATRVASP